MTRQNTKLNRSTFATSRLMDFCSEKELTAQTGHGRNDWPLVILKELMDNALDACEEAGVAPEIDVQVTQDGIVVTDNGPGLPAATIEKVLDFSVRVSSREAYVAPDRGAQGNALKTVMMMPFTLDHQQGRVEIVAGGVRHIINVAVDSIRQQPVVDHKQEEDQLVKKGTCISVTWPDSACSILTDAKDRFLQIAEDYGFLNPHLTLTLNWMGEEMRIGAIDPDWHKWRPSEPTCPHWYRLEDLTRLLGAYVADDQDHGHDRMVRDFISEFRGLSASAKQKKILDATGLQRVNLSALVDGHDLRRDRVEVLLQAMRENTKPVKPNDLGVIGKDNLAAKFGAVGCEMKSFDYRKVIAENDEGLPFVLETAFGWCESLPQRRMVLGVNWSPGILNPFRQLGSLGVSLDSILERQRVGRDEPVVLLLHCASPRVRYMDRGKSAVEVRGGGPQ